MKTPMQPDPRDYEIRIWYSAEKGDECFIAQVVEWSDWDEPTWPDKAARVAVERCGKQPRYNGPGSWRMAIRAKKRPTKFSSRSKALWKSQPNKASNRQRLRSRTPRDVARHGGSRMKTDDLSTCHSSLSSIQRFNASTIRRSKNSTIHATCQPAAFPRHSRCGDRNRNAV